jgi:carbon-monoxide dehydrogenase medium subunit
LPKIATPQTLAGLSKVLTRKGKKSVIVADDETIRASESQNLVDVRGIPGFTDIRKTRTKVVIGCGATFGQLLRGVSGENGLLQQAVTMMANPLVRNRVTVLAGLDPESTYFDLSTALLALDARVSLETGRGSRTLPITDYLVRAANGLKAGEFPASVEFAPLAPDQRVGFFRVNPGPDRNTVSAAVVTRIRRGGAFGPSIFVSSSTLIPIATPAASASLSGRPVNEPNVRIAAELAAGEVIEADDTDSNAYESTAVQVAVTRAFQRLSPPAVP